MSKYETVDDVNAQLDRVGPLFVRMAEYRETFMYVHVVLSTDGRVPDANLYMEGCWYISGHLSGGPWKLRLIKIDSAGGGVRLECNDNELVIAANRVQLDVRQPP